METLGWRWNAVKLNLPNILQRTKILQLFEDRLYTENKCSWRGISKSSSPEKYTKNRKKQPILSTIFFTIQINNSAKIVTERRP